VFDWTVPLTVGGTAVTVSGRLVWLGAPAHSTLELTLYVLGATLGLLALGMLAIRLVRAWRPAAGVGTGDGARGGDGGARGGDGGAKGGDGGAKGGDGADSGDDGDSAEGGVAAAGRPSGSAAGVT
jgi:hypothetical protein